MNGITINIGWEYFLGIIGFLIGVAWYAGSRFSTLDTSVKWIRESITKLEGRMDNAFGQGSPIKLFQKGIEILNESGLREYIETNKESLLSECGFKSGLTNQYDIQEKAFSCFDQLDFGELEPRLKEVSYKHGVSLETVKRVGGIYFRDVALTENGFVPEDLDKPKTS